VGENKREGGGISDLGGSPPPNNEGKRRKYTGERAGCVKEGPEKMSTLAKSASMNNEAEKNLETKLLEWEKAMEDGRANQC